MLACVGTGGLQNLSRMRSEVMAAMPSALAILYALMATRRMYSTVVHRMAFHPVLEISFGGDSSMYLRMVRWTMPRASS